MSNENFLWCKLDKHFFNFEEDLYVCSIYIPPNTHSSREKRLQKDHFKVLLETINNIRSENIILIARTKLYEDVIAFDRYFDDLMPDTLLSRIKYKRANKIRKQTNMVRSLLIFVFHQNYILRMDEL